MVKVVLGEMLSETSEKFIFKIMLVKNNNISKKVNFSVVSASCLEDTYIQPTKRKGDL